MRNRLFYAVSVAAALLSVTTSFAQDAYPSRPVTIIVPYAAGGSSDQVARVLGAQLSVDLGQGFIVENQPGGSGIIGASTVAKAVPDGYTLMMADPSFSIIPNWFETLPFDVQKDFQPVSQIISSPTVLVVRPELNFNSVKDLIDYAHANPGQLKYGSAGLGGAPYMWSEQFKLETKSDIKHIAYKGSGDVITALLGGEVDMLITTIPTATAQIKAGKLKPLAVSGDKRVASMPDVPTMTEAGVSGMAAAAFMGLVGPAGIPQDILDKLHADIQKAIATPAVQEKYIAMSSVPVGSTATEFADLIKSEIQKWADVMKLGGIAKN